MKRFLIISFISLLAFNNNRAGRIITSFDIARWYLDSDLVLICNASRIDTIILSHHDYYTPDSLRLTYDMIREIYHIDIDSVIKSCGYQNVLIECIYSQDFSTNYSKTKQGEDSFIYKLNELGDTIGVDTLKSIIMYLDDYSDNSYFRLKNSNKHLVILSLTQNGYVIDFSTEISDSILELISEVKRKGQAYFDFIKKLD